MSKRLQKVVSVTTSVTTILWLSGVAAFAPMAAFAATINEGDIIKTATNPDVYIAKYVGAKKFKRLILNPDVFNSYGHLKWSNLKTVTQAEMDAFTTSDLVRALNDTKVYKLIPNGDVGTKQWMNMTAEAFTAGNWDWDSIYVINNVDRDNYTAGSDITGGNSASPSSSPSTAAGSLSVSLASDTPAAGVAPLKAARVPFTKIALTAGASDVTVKAITAQRTGLAADTSLSSIALIDNQTNLQVGLNQTLNASHQVTVREDITIPANTTKYYTLAANMPSSAATSHAGEIAALALVSVETSATVSGALPISGNGQTINETLSIGTFSGSAGSLNVSTSTKAVGTSGFNFSGAKFTAGSVEDVTIYSIRFNQSGSAAASDLANVVVSDGSTKYATTVSADGKYYTASFGTAGLVIGKGLSKEFTVNGDIVGGSARTIKFDIYRATDIVVKGNTYGYYLTIDTNTTNPFNTGLNPVFMGATITVGSGSLRVDKSSTGAPSGNIAKGATGVVLGAFDFVVTGEPVNVSSLVLTMDMSGTTASSTDFTNITLTKADGTILAGPVDGVDTSTANPDGTATFSGTISFPVGTTQVLVKGNMSTDPAANATIIVSFNTPATKITSITGGTTGNAITATPTSQVSANTMTVKAGALTVSVGSPVNQTVVRGASDFTFANYIFDASASGENVKVTTISLRDTITASGDASQLSNVVMYDGSAALNTGSNVVSLSGTAATNDFTFTLDNPLIIPAGTQKTVALKGNISGSATAASTHAWGLASGAAVTATGVSTTLDIGETVNAGTGSVITIASSGQYSVALDASSPTVGKLIAAGTSGVTMTVLNFYATSEPITITKVRLALTNSSSTMNDIQKVYLYDGSSSTPLNGADGTAIGINNVVGGTANASTTVSLTTPLVIPANTHKIVTIKANIGTIDTVANQATAGHSVAVNFYGSTDTNENVGSGQSGAIANYSATTAATSHYIYRAYPTVAETVTSSFSANTTAAILNTFTVTANGGDVDLYKVTMNISTSTGAVALDNLTLYQGSSVLYASTTNWYVDVHGAYADFIFRANPGTSATAVPVTITAGTSKTFVLRGDVSYTGSATSFTVTAKLAGDSAEVAKVSGTYGLTAANVNLDAENDFIWSDWSDADHSSSAAGASTTDWYNGYLMDVPSSAL